MCMRKLSISMFLQTQRFQVFLNLVIVHNLVNRQLMTSESLMLYSRQTKQDLLWRVDWVFPQNISSNSHFLFHISYSFLIDSYTPSIHPWERMTLFWWLCCFAFECNVYKILHHPQEKKNQYSLVTCRYVIHDTSFQDLDMG